MPLFEIRTIPAYQPADHPTFDTPLQAQIAMLGDYLPHLIVNYAVELLLDPDETPLDGVQVDYSLFHPRAVNTPYVWIFVLFVEPTPSEEDQLKIKSALKRIIYRWFADNKIPVPPRFTVDAFWGPGRGFLNFEGVEIEW